MPSETADEAPEAAVVQEAKSVLEGARVEAPEAPTSAAGPTPTQNRQIHALVPDLCWDEETYRVKLVERFGVTSSKELTPDQATKLLRALKSTLDRQRGAADHAPGPSPVSQATKAVAAGTIGELEAQWAADDDNTPDPYAVQEN